MWGGGGLPRQHVEQPRESLLEVVAPQRDEPQRALRLCARDAGLPQEPEVVGAGRRRDAERARELVADPRSVVAEEANDLEADGSPSVRMIVASSRLEAGG